MEHPEATFYWFYYEPTLMLDSALDVTEPQEQQTLPSTDSKDEDVPS